ncbi:MAG: dihydropteroate synthase [Cryomorphaceae bacterium]|nr:dihydropteroate synthase [Cryomorphaceae bacterium]
MISVNGRLLDIQQPLIMGIINVTPDSFYKGSRAETQKDVLHKAKEMLEQGADILDLGAQSTRPNATILTAEEEWKRLSEVIPLLISTYPDAVLSVDTFYADVAERAINAGAAIVNDVSGGALDKRMFSMVAELRVPYIMMHSRGNAQTMQSMTQYDDVVEEVIRFFYERVDQLRRLGQTDIIIDPGFGFAKTVDQSFKLLKHIEALSVLQLPILAGVSRKSMIYKSLGVTPDEALHGTTALHMWCLSHGVRILRVHDVTAAKHAVEMYKRLCQ